MPSFFSETIEKLPDIHFPEFTAKLLTDTFDAIIAANLRQTESYIELVGAMSKTLPDYIQATKDEISGAEILEFLAMVIPQPATKVKTDGLLMDDEAAALTKALTVPGQTGAITIPTSALKEGDVTNIMQAVAIRLAANRYTLLKEMVKMGIVRVVATHGMIRSELTFSTWVSNFYKRDSSTYDTKDFQLNASAKTGKALAKWFSASASTKYQTVKVRTTNETQQDNSGSTVNIFGRVEVHFKTDFQPLNQLPAAEPVASATGGGGGGPKPIDEL